MDVPSEDISAQEWKKLVTEVNRAWQGEVDVFLKMHFNQDIMVLSGSAEIANFYVVMGRLLRSVKRDYQSRRRNTEFASLLKRIVENDSATPQQRVQILRSMAVKNNESVELHMILGALWHVGLDKAQFRELCRETLPSVAVRQYHAAKRLFGSACDLNAEGGKEAATLLEEANIVVNMQVIPYDPRPPLQPSGIRLGSPAITTRGMKEADCRQIGDWIAEIVKRPAETRLRRAIRAKVVELTKRYPIY